MANDHSGRLDPRAGIVDAPKRVQGRGHKDVFLHTLQVVDNVAALSPKPELRFAALVHDIAKPVTKRYDAQRGWTFHHHEEVGRGDGVEFQHQSGF